MRRWRASVRSDALALLRISRVARGGRPRYRSLNSGVNLVVNDPSGPETWNTPR